MNTTHDIPTTPDAPALIIKDNKHLVDVIFEMAEQQLILNRAEADMQSRVEVLKKAYDEATAEHAAQINTLLTSVEAYAITNKDKLFPVKGGKRSKTFKVLQHALKFRESSSVEVPEDATDQINRLIRTLHVWPDQWNGLTPQEVIGWLEGLLRTPAVEFNKEAFKTLLQNKDLAELAEVLRLNGYHLRSAETFKVEFNFTPEAA